jgi:hypothetical protein
MPAPLYVGHEDLMGLFRFALFHKQNARFGVRAAFSTGLKQGFRQGDDAQNFRPASKEGDDVLIRRVAENALGQHDPKSTTGLQELDAPLKEEDLGWLMFVETRGLLGDFRRLVPLPLMAELELREETLALDLNLCAEWRVGQDNAE